MAKSASVGVSFLGCGTVGSAVADMALHETRLLAARSGITLELRKILVRDISKKRGADVPAKYLTTQIDDILKDSKTQIVIELMGGLEPARQYVLAALKAGKHVVTANKYLLAIHGREIFAAAKKADRCVAFEASCGGAIPIIGALTRGLLANDISRITGIVNGTCNYILTQMTRNGQSYATALAGAQAAGYAEPDPTLDVNGTDSAHKLAVLAGLAFGVEVPFDQVEISGIDLLQDTDLKYGKELGYVCKLLAIGQKITLKDGDVGVSLRVHPTFVPVESPIANVHGPFNAITVEGHAAGQTLYYGRVAGPKPTASAVLADVLDVAIGTAPLQFRQLPMLTHRSKVDLIPSSEVSSRNYLRITALDVPGVMAKVTRILGDKGISIAAIVQHEANAGQPVPVVCMTHEAKDGDVAQAIKQIDKLDVVSAPTVRIKVLA